VYSFETELNIQAAKQKQKAKEFQESYGKRSGIE
jgi:hypothetical protein